MPLSLLRDRRCQEAQVGRGRDILWAGAPASIHILSEQPKLTAQELNRRLEREPVVSAQPGWAQEWGDA